MMGILMVTATLLCGPVIVEEVGEQPVLTEERIQKLKRDAFFLTCLQFITERLTEERSNAFARGYCYAKAEAVEEQRSSVPIPRFVPRVEMFANVPVE